MYLSGNCNDDEGVSSSDYASAWPLVATPPWAASKPVQRSWGLGEVFRFDAEQLLFLAVEMRRIATFLETAKDQADLFRTNEEKEADASRLSEYKPLLKQLGLHMSHKQVDRIIIECEKKQLLSKDLAKMVGELSTRLHDEMGLYVCLCLTQHEAEYLSPHNPLFGDEFVKGFPTDGAFELEEAAKSFALSRFTASVFHLMRIMEIGIRAMARCLFIPDPIHPAQRNWGEILKALKTAIYVKWPTTADRMAGDGADFEALLASLDAVKNPWRNATMHVENKYTQAEAEHIFFAVKGFMKKLAYRMDERGEPKA